MSKKNVIAAVEKLILPVIQKHNFELVEVEFVKEGANWFLRIYIDKPGGIHIDDCQAVSLEVSPLLDEHDYIGQPYHLEISSPGLDRPLKNERDFVKYKGEEVEVKLFKPLNGQKLFVGQLEGLVENEILIKSNDGLLRFHKEQVALVKRVIQF